MYRPRRKYAAKRKLIRRKRYARRPIRRVPRHPTGFLSLIRKASQITTYSTAGGFGFTVNDPTGTCLSVGTPVGISGTDNCYDIPFSMAFALSQVMNATDITNFADQFKLVSAFVKVHANWNMNGSAQANTIPFIEYIQDHDDAVVPSLAQLREKMGTRTKYFSASKPVIQMGVRPRFADVIYQNAVAPTAAAGVGSRREWLNTTNSNTLHYGIKGVLHNVYLPSAAAGGTLFNWDVSLKIVAKDFQ